MTYVFDTAAITQQIQFAQQCTETFSSTDNELPGAENREGARVVADYESILKTLLLDLKPDLESIETRIIGPIRAGLEALKGVRKTTEKRNHKQLDFDRRRASLKKLQERSDRSLRDETALYRAENDAEQAKQDFDYFNDLLKRELIRLFELEQQFIQPLFQIFYFIQLRIFYQTYAALQKVSIDAMDLRGDIESAFLIKRKDVRERVENMAILHSRNPDVLEGKSKYQKASEFPTKTTLGSKVSALTPGKGGGSGKQSSASSTLGKIQPMEPPPPYPLQGPSSSADAASSSGLEMPAVQQKTATDEKGQSVGVADMFMPPPPPPPRPNAPPINVSKPETVTAVYSFEAQQEGDLHFEAGDVIEVITRGSGEDDWWVGRLNGKEGQFPGE